MTKKKLYREMTVYFCMVIIVLITGYVYYSEPIDRSILKLFMNILE